MTGFDQSQHPRNAAGTSKGGQFAAKQNSAPEVGLGSAVNSKSPNWEALAAKTSIPEMSPRRIEILDSARKRAWYDVKNSMVIGSGDVGPADALLIAKSFHPDAEYAGHNPIGLPVYRWSEK